MPKGFPKNERPDLYPPKDGEAPPPPDVPPAPEPPADSSAGGVSAANGGGNGAAVSAGAVAARPKRSNQYTKKNEAKALENAQQKDALDALSNENIGAALGGAFQLVGMLPGKLGGPHWRLFSDEEASLGKAFGPLCRKHPELLGELVQYVVLAPTVLAVMAPRVFVTGHVWRGSFPVDAARHELLRARVMMKAERELNIELQAAEAKEILRRQASEAASLAASLKAQELVTTQGGVPAQPQPLRVVPQEPVQPPPAQTDASKYTADESLPPGLVSVATATST